jgi:hypothetical protein
MRWHGLVSLVEGPSIHEMRTPIHKVVLEHALVKLMKNVGGYCGEDVAVGKGTPKWGWDGAKTIRCEGALLRESLLKAWP